MFRTPSRPGAPRVQSRPTTPSTPRSSSSGAPQQQQHYTGSISVSIRIKPSSNQHQILPHTDKVITVPELGDYTFDNVFGPSVNNSQVYSSIVKGMIGKLVEGYNATVFAYGMTGSGKTHSMMGNGQELGVIPLAVHELFGFIEGEESYKVKVSYLEIYNEKINDLLDPMNSDLKLREMSDDQGVQVLGITEKIVSSAQSLLGFVDQGNENRQTNSTEYNLKSSRSHAIVQIRLISPSTISTLSLCDLAGSEKATTSSDRRKEGSFINKSLLSLTNVIVKLSTATTQPSSTQSTRPSSRIGAGRPSSSLGRQQTPGRRGTSLSTPTIHSSASTSALGSRTPMRPTSTLSFGRASSSLSSRSYDQTSTNTSSGSSSSAPTGSSSSVGHIPYRDSKLTRLLQSSLSGDAIVSILCTVSSTGPSNPNSVSSAGLNVSTTNGVLTETINTIRFASRAKNIKLNAKKHENGLFGGAGDKDKNKLIEKLKDELREKELEIEELKKSKRRDFTGSMLSVSSDNAEMSSVKDKIIQLESENKILIERQTHLERLLESRNYSSTILKNEIIEQIVNRDLSTDDMVIKLEELFKLKFIETEEYRSYVAHLENSLKLQISQNRRELEATNSSSSSSISLENEQIEQLNAVVNQQREEISDLSKTLQNKEKIINFLKSSMRLNDNLLNTINHDTSPSSNSSPTNALKISNRASIFDSSMHADKITNEETNDENRKIFRVDERSKRRDTVLIDGELSGVLEVEES